MLADRGTCSNQEKVWGTRESSRLYSLNIEQKKLKTKKLTLKKI